MHNKVILLSEWSGFHMLNKYYIIDQNLSLWVFGPPLHVVPGLTYLGHCIRNRIV